MKKLFIGLAIILLSVIILPPMWFVIFPETPRLLPAPGEKIEVAPSVSVNVLDTGAGKPVVLVHGLPGSAYDWRNLAPELESGGFRVIAYDRVGYGHSGTRPGSDYSLRSNTLELLALLEALDLRDVTIVGWSYGGAMAMQAVGIDGQRIGRLVLVGTGGPSSEEDEPPEPSLIINILYSNPVLRWRAAVPPVSRGLQTVLSDVAFSGGDQPAWWLRDLAANFSRWETVTTYKSEILSKIEPAGISPATIAVPTLIIHAEDDQLAPVEIGRYLSRIIPDVIYHEVPGASHMLPVTHPTLLAGKMKEFINQAD